MKDQIKTQISSEKLPQEVMFIADQLESQQENASTVFNSADQMKRTLPTGMSKKINPRLLIL
jgi:hypothetical protein